jgi:phospholipid/cholesterol/gamma-HCH transport system ATP-binding protein
VVLQNRDHRHIVEMKGVHFSRGDRKILNGVDISIERGKITAVMGPSGTGKTTILRLIGGLLKPDAGTVHINSVNVHELSRGALNKLREQMSMLFQSGALFSEMSVFDNVAFVLREHTKLPESMIRDLVLMKLHAVGLRGARDLSPRELSGGMARRAALARSIALDPEIIMYDEPFAGQDPISMGVLIKLISLLNDALDMTSIIVSHDVQETASIADYIYIVSNGQIIGEGTPEALMNSEAPQVQQFMRGLPDGPVPFHYPARDYASDLIGD